MGENSRNGFDAATLEYKNPENNAWRVVKCVNDVLYPPDESGWGDYVYIPVISVKSSQGLKPKIPETSPNEDDQELDPLLTTFFDGEEVKQEPKVEEQIKIVDNRQEDINNNDKSRDKEMELEMENRRSSRINNKGQSFVVKNIIKCEENETQNVLLEKCSVRSLKKAKKRKSMLLVECSACKKFLTHSYMKDHVRRCPMMKAN